MPKRTGIQWPQQWEGSVYVSSRNSYTTPGRYSGHARSGTRPGCSHTLRQEGWERAVFYSYFLKWEVARGEGIDRDLSFFPSLPTERMKDRVLTLDECGRGREWNGTAGFEERVWLEGRAATAGARGRVGRERGRCVRGVWAGLIRSSRRGRVGEKERRPPLSVGSREEGKGKSRLIKGEE
jgi:hypothetical protein